MSSKDPKGVRSGEPGRFYGKYRAVVLDNADPRRLGRVWLALGDASRELGWAMPCVPYAGPGVGLFAPPPVGASVWVEFEAGDPEFPIWSGCFWAEGELPPEAAQAADSAEVQVWSTPAGSVAFDGAGGEGRLVLRLTGSANGVAVTLDSEGVTVAAGDRSVRIEGGAIELDSDHDLSIEAGDTIRIESQQEIEIDAGSSLAASSGAETTIAAGSSVQVEASSSAELSSAGTTEVRGSLLRLNDGGMPAAKVGDTVAGDKIVGPGSVTVLLG